MQDCHLSQLDPQIQQKVALLRSHGLEAGDILAVQLPTSIDFIALLFAAIQIGAIFCPLNLRLPAAATQLQLQQLRPKLFFSITGRQSFTAEKTPLPPSSLLLFTSGSSGAPKMVSLSYLNFLSAAQSAIIACDLEPDDLWLLSLPLYHVGGLSILFRCLLSGAKITTDPTHLGITHLSYVPTQLYRSWPIYPRLKTIVLSGAPIHEIPNQLPILAAYGMTETASMIVGQRKAPLKNSFYYLGRPHSGKNLRLSPEGEIFVKGDSLFQGYWNGTELIAAPDWFATKDIGLWDPIDGLAIVGRKDYQFISGGENIQPEEIEKALLTHPLIVEAVVIGKSDLEFGQRPVAFIRTTQSLAEIELRAYLAERLPTYKIPVQFLSLEGIAQPGMKPSRSLLATLLL